MYLEGSQCLTKSIGKVIKLNFLLNKNEEYIFDKITMSGKLEVQNMSDTKLKTLLKQEHFLIFR